MRTLVACALVVAATAAASADIRHGSVPRFDPDFQRGLDTRWRLEGSFGLRIGSFLVDNASTGTRFAGHIDVGMRRARWRLYGEYGLMGVAVDTARAAARGLPVLAATGRGLVHRIGANARYAFGRITCSDCSFELYVEGGVGVQHFRWDAGGYWTRPDLAVGFGITSWGAKKRRMGGGSLGLRVLLSPRSDVSNDAPTTCGGPCDAPGKPTALDRAFMVDITMHFGT